MGAARLEILAYEDTPLGPICLRRRELISRPGVVVTEVTLNHEFLMSSYNTESERVLAGRSIEIHGGDQLKALVGGLGLGFTTRELMNHPQVEHVEVVEYLPQVVQWVRDGLGPLSHELSAAENLSLVQGDIYQRLLAEPLETFDLIVIDVDHSPNDQLGDVEHEFYSIAGLRSAIAHLRVGGVLAVWSYDESSSFADALNAVFDRVHVEPVRTMNDLVGYEQTDWLFFGSN